MSKKTIDAVAMPVAKANAQNLTCVIAFIVSASLSIVLMLVACVMPAMISVTEVICWIAMALEAASIGFGCIAYWVKRNAL